MDLEAHGIDLPAGPLRRYRIRQRLPKHDYDPGLKRIAGELDALLDPALLTASQASSTLFKVQEIQNQLDAYRDHLAFATKAAGYARELHAGSTGVFTAIASTQNPAHGSASLRRGELLARFPGIDQAYRAGRVSKAHVEVIREACDKIHDFEDIEAFIADVCAELEPSGVAHVLLKLVEADLGPEDHEKELEKSRRRRGLTISDHGGDAIIRGRLDMLQARILRDALHPGMNTDTPGDTRTTDQKRADVLIDVIQAGMASSRPGGISGVTVLVDIDDLGTGQGARYEDGTPIPASAFEKSTDQAVVFYLFGRRVEARFLPLAVAREKRFATAVQWKALVARDRGCINCGAKPRHTHAHHVKSWRDGGETTISNLCLLCSACHADLHAGYYRITMTNGLPEITRLCPGRSPP